MSKGEILERDAHQFLWDLGYMVLPRFKIHATKIRGTKSIEVIDITDLDVYGIRFGPFLEKETFLIDCKHRSDGVFSQVLKAVGIASLLDIKNLLVLRSSVSEPVQRFSELFGVKLVNIDEFRRRVEKREGGSFSLSSYKLVTDCIDGMSPSGRTILARMTNAFVDSNPYRRFKTLRMLYEEAKRELEETLASKSTEFLLFRIFQLATIAFAEMAADTTHLSKYHFNNYLQSRIIGDVEFKLRAFKRLVTNESLMTSLEKDLGPLTPTYFDILKSHIDNLRTHSYYVQLHLRYNDYVIHAFGLPGKKPDWTEIGGEFGEVDGSVLSKWNQAVLQLLDDEKTFPIFMVKLLV